MGQGIAAADWPVIETVPPSGFTRHEVDHCGAIVESAESARVWKTMVFNCYFLKNSKIFPILQNVS